MNVIIQQVTRVPGTSTLTILQCCTVKSQMSCHILLVDAHLNSCPNNYNVHPHKRFISPQAENFQLSTDKFIQVSKTYLFHQYFRLVYVLMLAQNI